MTDDNRSMTEILFKAIRDTTVIYNKNNYPNLKKNDYEVLGPLFRNIKHSVKFNIELNHPNIKIENIPPKIVFVTFLKQVHNIDLEKDELDLILKNIKEFV